ncbi:methylated-DNA--[protein]-cysteine S-methyltransferase [Tuwongella immobilis]|uniref:Methylated-DNA--protein-cysteine methyltransferase n=1 Tax=Tuwongella immobilis TaxID=692036 RepID=A0A6C2YJC7_9BACT|nr:methylated-DNA--[protein]-cysteine S-methyltransferase [Tuwongella immobilis]VIP01670.1 cysteine methyltransferase : Methylated-DNA--protein-cysteine methyltransferase OS=Marinobacter nanhaiticus D15-8W GN=J057_16580 PE=3 SV=1: Methyltransf_1N: DNA_binding_1 [Tuwongella immobilis]VTR99098.1 cysteine methyltransferase : Methylated-DNA--protein-cysteine methyltransferase OS=Marinobacter nanhaiticus D15-8W GN=J057_16580 PE=3 SV=1: Methyltransf_1N: DNA_binding_1 [Tuwongella immobilis]
MIARLVYSILPSPVGNLWLLSNGMALTGLYFGKPSADIGDPTHWVQDDAWLAPVREQLSEYFAGHLREFDLPLEPDGTAFQKQVWSELSRIPYGETVSYADIAERIGRPSSSRAVGMANGRNPISIIVPCHRVIGRNGQLVGYGGGLDNKQWLLRHEAESLGVTGDGLFGRGIIQQES